MKLMHITRFAILALFVMFCNKAKSALTCSDGYYLSNDVCSKCDSTCLTCSDSTSCNQCHENMYTNNTSKCQFCNYGQFYSTTLHACLDCGDSCNDQCMYQEKCFSLPTGKILDLSSVSCVDRCDLSNQILIKDSQLGNNPVCKNLTYYVDSTSNSTIELGTKRFPFKNFGLVFVELANYHLHTNRTINIYLKENSINELKIANNYIINTTLVNIQSYSSSNSSKPQKAIIMMKDGNTTLLSPFTQFNIIKNTDLRLDSAITQNSQYSQLEKIYLTKTDACIFISRSSVTFDNLIFKSDLSSTNLPIFYLRPVYLQTNTLTMTNIDFVEISGRLMFSYDPMNIHLENITVDCNLLMGGFTIYSACNYPEANTHDTQIIKNITFYQSGDRNVSIVDTMLSYFGTGNFSLDITYSEVYGTITQSFPPFGLALTPLCLPSDSDLRIVNITNLSYTVKDNGLQNQMLSIGGSLSADGYTRFTSFIYSNNRHWNIPYCYFPVFGVGSSPLVDITMINNTFENCSARLYLMFIASVRNFVISGLHIKNLYPMAYQILIITQFTYLDISDMTWTNDVPIRSINSTLALNKINVYNTTLIRNLIDCEFVSNGKLFIINSNFNNVKLITGKSLTKTKIINQFLIKNCTLNKITEASISDTSTSIFNIEALNLDTNLTFEISDVIISNSSSQFFKLNGIQNLPAISKYLNITNVQFSEATISYPSSLIEFGNIETQADFSIIISQIMFDSIYFPIGGNFLSLGHQTSNTMIVQDSVFQNSYGGSIHIESANKQRIDLSTKVTINNMTANNLNGNFNSFLKIYLGGEVNVTNSVFPNIYNFQSGAVMYAGDQNPKTTSKNSVFTNNTSITGGVFDVEYNSLLILDSCSVFNNFAFQSGVVQINSNGYFQFYNSIFHHNYAISSSFGEIFDTSQLSVLNNCTLYQNYIKLYEEIINEVKSCVDLCFLHKEFKTYIKNNSIKIVPIPYLISIMFGKISIENNTGFSYQDALIKSYLSSVSSNNISLPYLTFSNSLMNLVSTNASFANTKISSCSTSENLPIFMVSLDSIFSIDQLNYSDSNSQLVFIDSSKINLTNIEMNNLTSSDIMIHIHNSDSVVLQNIKIKLLSIKSCSAFTGAISISKSRINLISNSEFTNSNCNALIFEESSIKLISNIAVSNYLNAISLIRSNISMLNSRFNNCGNNSTFKGGAIYSLSSNITISNTNFANNSAIEGAGIYIDCISGDYCFSELLNTNFTNNLAKKSGGAISYSFKRPILSNNIFINNSAPYGPNIASYPIRANGGETFSNEITLVNLGSGLLSPNALVLSLVDYDNQTMVLDSTSQLKITPTINSTRVSGVNVAKVWNGIATFNQLIFIGPPGSHNMYFKISSKAIDVEKLFENFGDQMYDNAIKVSFRFCQPGEIIQNNECKTCAPRTYSFNWNSTLCSNCMNNAVCLGGTQVNVASGYWRKTSNSTKIIECPNPKACDGNYVDQEMFPVECHEGYYGYLCGSCIIANGTKYEQVSSFECAKCPDPALNAIRVVGVIILAFLFLMILIIINIRKTRESQTSILLRIFTNYLQLITVSLSFNMKFPSEITSAFIPIQKVSSSDTFLSFDCFIDNTEIRAFAPNNSIFKIFLASLLPIIIFVFASLVFVILRIVWKKRFSDIRRNIGISAICIIFLLHPTLTRESFSIFQCIDIDSNDSRMRLDLDIVCYSSEHIFWMLILGLPMISIWIFGSILFALLILIRNRDYLEDTKIKRYFLILYQGLRPKAFYWEFVNTIRKVIIVIINVILANYSGMYRVLLSVFVLVAILRFQIYLKPYKDPNNNEIEMKAIIVGSFTIYCGTIFVTESTSYVVMNIFLLIMLFASNIYFVLVWSLHLLLSLDSKSKYISVLLFILSIILNQRKLVNKQNISNIIRIIDPHDLGSLDHQAMSPKKKQKRIKHKQKIKFKLGRRRQHAEVFEEVKEPSDSKSISLKRTDHGFKEFINSDVRDAFRNEVKGKHKKFEIQAILEDEDEY